MIVVCCAKFLVYLVASMLLYSATRFASGTTPSGIVLYYGYSWHNKCVGKGVYQYGLGDEYMMHHVLC